MWAKKLKIVCLLLAGFWGVLSTVLPHHHHANGMICLEIEIPGCDNTHAQNKAEDPADCSGCCWFAYKTPVDVISLHQHLSLKFAPVKILLGTWAMLPDLTVEPLEGSPCEAVYVERLHPVLSLHASGLRAPPVA